VDHHVGPPATVQVLQQQSRTVDAVLAPCRRRGPDWRMLVIVAGRVRNAVARDLASQEGAPEMLITLRP
jgi:hypothetical protein